MQSSWRTKTPKTRIFNVGHKTLAHQSPAKQTCRQDKGKYLKPFQHCIYLVRKSRKTCKRKLLDFAALVINLQKTVLKIRALRQDWIKCVWNLWWHEDCGENSRIFHDKFVCWASPNRRLL